LGAAGDVLAADSGEQGAAQVGDVADGKRSAVVPAVVAGCVAGYQLGGLGDWHAQDAYGGCQRVREEVDRAGERLGAAQGGDAVADLDVAVGERVLAVAETGLAAAVSELAPGTTEQALTGVMLEAMAAGGVSTSATQDGAWVTSREHSWRVGRRDVRLQDGDLVAFASGALSDGYVGEVGRTWPVGEVKGADELYGEVLLADGRAKEAVAWFERALTRTPNRSRAVLGLARAAAKSGEGVKSRTAYKQLLKSWSLADPGLPELAEARAALGAARPKIEREQSR